MVTYTTSTDADVAAILDTFSATSFKLPPSQYTVAAAFFLTDPFKVISLATGTKCLPIVRLPSAGEALHDSHAEVLARRGAVHWFFDEIARCRIPTNPYTSPWIHTLQDERYALRDGVQIHLYISTVPCGDASTRFLASLQDAGMAALKDAAPPTTPCPGAASRGRDGYAHLGVLRTKPGRADSPPTLCMSCSDKIAAWSVLGIQGALLARFVSPLYIARVVIGEVPPEMQDRVKEDCQRALWRRLDGIKSLPRGYALHTPAIQFTSQTFPYSRTAIGEPAPGSANESLCWIANTKPHEVLINGLKRGVSPKHRFHEKSKPRTSRISMFQLYGKTLGYFGHMHEPQRATYHETKRTISDYRIAKEALMGKHGPFSGWVRAGIEWQNFDINGTKHSDQDKASTGQPQLLV